MSEAIYQVEEQEGITIMTLTLNTLTHEDNRELMQAFDALLNAGNKKIILDLLNTKYISSLILASLVFMQKRAKDTGGNLLICNVQNQVKEIIEVTNLDKIFDIMTDRQAAIDKLAGKSQESQKSPESQKSQKSQESKKSKK